MESGCAKLTQKPVLKQCGPADRIHPRLMICGVVHCGFDLALLSFADLLFYLNDALSMRDGEDHMLLAEGLTSQITGRALG